MSSVQTPGFVEEWIETLEPCSFVDISTDPRSIAFFSADLINGFVHHGPLASPRVTSLIPPVKDLFFHGWEYGIRDVVLIQDTHSPDTPEFETYPPHAMQGSDESRTIPELQGLPFAEGVVVIEKNSLHPAIGTNFDSWLDNHPQIRHAIVVGDCTDLCVYQLAMHLRLRANALNEAGWTVTVPANCVQTFDIPAVASMPGAGHPGDFFHNVFLYHMASNGIRVVSELIQPGETTLKGVARR